MPSFHRQLGSLVVSEDSLVELVPLDVSHFEGIKAAASDGELWNLRYTSVPEPSQALAYIERAMIPMPLGPQVAFAVVDRASGAVIGSTRYYNVDDTLRRVYIGYTWYAQRMQRTHVNTTCKLELLRHAFDVCAANVVVWETDSINTRSQAAIERLGAKRDGVLRYAMLRKDLTVRDTVVYSMLASEWPVARENLRTRLNQHSSTNARQASTAPTPSSKQI